MSLSRSQAVIIGIVVLIVLFFIFGLLGIIPIFKKGPNNNQQQAEVVLNFWGVDDGGVFGSMIGAYQAARPGIQINYRKLDPYRYELDLIDSLAASTGPDIFMFDHSWLPKHKNKIIPVGENQFSLIDFKKIFPTVIEQDFTSDNKIYALPLYIDTLALFYNKDIFDNKGIVFPPKTWQELEKIVPKLTEVDKLGRVIKAAVALGGSSKSINHASDIVSLLMLQNKVQMADGGSGEATFAKDGAKNLRYYTQFANPASSLFNWDEKFGYSLDKFSEEKIAMIFDYSSTAKFLKEKNPYLPFSIAPMIQNEGVDKEINYADYWGLAVSNKSKNAAWAWDFIVYSTTNKELAKSYLIAANRSPALKTLIQDYLSDPLFITFAGQALTARSWSQVDNNEVDTSFSKMIESVLSGMPAESAINQAQDRINQLRKSR